MEALEAARCLVLADEDAVVARRSFAPRWSGTDIFTVHTAQPGWVAWSVESGDSGMEDVRADNAVEREVVVVNGWVVRMGALIVEKAGCQDRQIRDVDVVSEEIQGSRVVRF